MLEALLTGGKSTSKYYKKLTSTFPGRTRASLSVVGSLLYLIGGQVDPAGTTNDVNELWVYDPSSDTWTQKTVPGTVPGRRAHAAVVIGTKIYVIAGYNNSTGTMSDVWVYDTTANTWTSIAAIPTGMSTHIGWTATYNSEACIFVRGPDGSLFRYVPSTNTWTSLSTAFAKLANAAGTGVGELAYLFGGQVGTAAINNTMYKETAATPAEATVTPTTSLTPGAKIYHAMGYGNNRLFVRGGGADSSSANSDCWEYTIPNNVWRQLDSGGAAQRLHCAAYLNGKLYTYSGTSSPTSTRMTDFWSIDVDAQASYTKNKDLWTALTSGTAKSAPLVVSDGTYLYALGGLLTSTTYSDQIMRYDPSAKTWSQVGTLPNQLAAACGGVINGVIYFYGGTNGTAQNTLYSFNISTGVVATLAAGPRALFYGVSVVYGGKLYIFGGTGATVYNNLSCYDPTTNTWAEITPTGTVPSARFRLGATLVGSKMYVMGGVDNAGTFLKDIWAYDFVSNTWFNPGDMPNQLGGMDCNAIGNYIFLDGGFVGAYATVSAVAQVYDTVQKTWLTLTSRAKALEFSGSTVIAGEIYSYGGYVWNGATIQADLVKYTP